MDKKLIVNARKPQGDYGSKMIKRMNESHEEMAKWGVSHINVSEKDIVLDIGCGGGVNLKRFNQMAPQGKVYGLDYSEVSVEESIEYNKDEVNEGKVEVLQGSVSELPFEEEYFDFVTGFETVYFWPDFINDLKEIKRVLKKDGAIFICNEAKGSEKTLENMKEHIDLLNMTIYSEDELADSLIEAGFCDCVTFTKEGTDWVCALGRKP